MIYEVGKKQYSNSGWKQNDIDPWKMILLSKPPPLWNFLGLWPPLPWNFQFPPCRGSGFFLEPHIKNIIDLFPDMVAILN